MAHLHVGDAVIVKINMIYNDLDDFLLEDRDTNCIYYKYYISKPGYNINSLHIWNCSYVYQELYAIIDYKVNGKEFFLRVFYEKDIFNIALTVNDSLIYHSNNVDPILNNCLKQICSNKMIDGLQNQCINYINKIYNLKAFI